MRQERHRDTPLHGPQTRKSDHRVAAVTPMPTSRTPNINNRRRNRSCPPARGAAGTDVVGGTS